MQLTHTSHPYEHPTDCVHLSPSQTRLYDCDVAHVDFWLFPCPIELTKDWDDREQLIDLVDRIDIRERLTTVTINREESVILKIKEKIPHCQAYYEKLYAERSKGSFAA